MDATWTPTRRAATPHSRQRCLFAGKNDGEGRNRTGDTTIFSRVLYQLSYLAVWQPVDGSGRPQQAAEAVRRGRRPIPGTQTRLRTRTLEKATLLRPVRSELAVVTTARLSTVGPEAAVTSSSKL